MRKTNNSNIHLKWDVKLNVSSQMSLKSLPASLDRDAQTKGDLPSTMFAQRSLPPPFSLLQRLHSQQVFCPRSIPHILLPPVASIPSVLIPPVFSTLGHFSFRCIMTRASTIESTHFTQLQEHSPPENSPLEKFPRKTSPRKIPPGKCSPWKIPTLGKFFPLGKFLLRIFLPGKIPPPQENSPRTDSLPLPVIIQYVFQQLLLSTSLMIF